MINETEYDDVMKSYDEVIKTDEDIKRDRAVKRESKRKSKLWYKIINSKTLRTLMYGIVTGVYTILFCAVMIGVGFVCIKVLTVCHRAMDPYPDRYNIDLKYNDGICWYREMGK